MRKILMLIVLGIIPFRVFAQLKVFSDGKVTVNSNTNTIPSLFTAGQGTYSYSGYNMGMFTRIIPSVMTIGIKADANATSSTGYGRSFGMFGVGGLATSGYNYGVVGTVAGTNYGAGIYGCDNNVTGFVPGLYAGYFDGDTYVNGNLTATNFITPSDARLKNNLVPLSQMGSSLDNILNMNVVAYNYVKKEIPSVEKDTISASLLKDYENRQSLKSKKTHYGLVAQELQEIYPELVAKGQDGYLGVNYVELVPILIRSIQELKAELDEVKGKSRDIEKSLAASFEDEDPTAIGDATAIPAVATLAQNTPNPFSERTTIRFTLPENAKNAYIYIFDMSGKMQKQIPITPDMQSITIEGYELRAGMYIYSLVIGGKEINTKKMIITK